MLLKDYMAKKAVKFIMSDLEKDIKDPELKNKLSVILNNLYIAGYDLAIDECDKDNSKYGFVVADCLRTLEAPNEE